MSEPERWNTALVIVGGYFAFVLFALLTIRVVWWVRLRQKAVPCPHCESRCTHLFDRMPWRQCELWWCRWCRRAWTKQEGA